jgi:hypothetical protein
VEAQKWCKQIHDPRIHQQVMRIDLHRPGSRIKAQLLTEILAASHAFYLTLFMHETKQERSWTHGHHHEERRCLGIFAGVEHRAQRETKASVEMKKNFRD